MKYLVAVAVAATMLAVWLFPRALPVVVLSDRISREEALDRAAAFVREHELPGGTRTAVRFQRGDSLLTFVELAAGGKDSLDALVRGDDVAPYSWAVRHFTPRDVRETRVHFAPGGRLLGFTRRLAEEDRRPELTSDSAGRVALTVLTGWLGEPPDRWRLAATSYETRKTSGRVDRTFTFERSDRKIGGAPIRLDVVIAGDTPSAARRYVVIPESFLRRYGEMRSANGLYSLIADVGLLAIVVAGAVALRRFVRSRRLRWRAPLAVGGVIAILVAAAGLNEMSSQWYDYDTAMAPLMFQLTMLISVLVGGSVVGLLSAVTLVVAEAATREAFPAHLDWWKLWRHRGTREVAARVLGGYTLAAVALAYVVVFYLATRELLGWWVPSDLLDDPNLIATPAPWLAGIAMSLHAAVWEEAIFRALPLSLLSLWVGARPRRNLWMAGGVIATALVFGFAHSDYPSWPAYSRGVEIFLDACLWGFVFLRFGLIVTVIAHFLYNATLFGLFAAGGSALPYRVTAAVVMLAILAPAIAVAWKWVRQRGLTAAPPDARFDAWQAAALDDEQPGPPAPARARVLGARARTTAFAVIGAGALVALLAPHVPVRGARFTESRARVAAVADSIVAARGVSVAGWKRLIGTNADTVPALPRFLQHHDREELLTALATTYAVPVWWEVRYVRTAGNVAERAEEWRVKVRPDGLPLGLQHVVPDSAAGGRPDQPMMRRIARAALARAGLDTTVLVESKLEETVRPARLDATVTYTDTTVRLPAGAAARVSVSLAGLEAVSVRRHVELPEAFIREDRDQFMARGLIAALSGMALLTLVVVGSVRVIRRRPPLVSEPAPGRRVIAGAAGITAVLLLASALNEAPAMLFGYDTSETWSSFITSGIIGVAAMSVLLLLLFAGLWFAANALRRRAGMPVFPAPPARASDALVGGAALGSVIAMGGILLAAASSDIPQAPETSLPQMIPVLSHVLSLPPFLLGLLPVFAVPLLLIVTLARAWIWRLLLALILLGLLAGVMLPARSGAASAMSIALSIATVVATGVAVRAWGALGLAAWIAAALAAYALLGTRAALDAANALDAWSFAFGALAAVGALALGAWAANRRDALRSPEPGALAHR